MSKTPGEVAKQAAEAQKARACWRDAEQYINVTVTGRDRHMRHINRLKRLESQGTAIDHQSKSANGEKDIFGNPWVQIDYIAFSGLRYSREWIHRFMDWLDALELQIPYTVDFHESCYIDRLRAVDCATTSLGRMHSPLRDFVFPEENKALHSAES